MAQAYIPILIVEDDRELQALYLDRFIQEGFAVYQAFDGNSGLKVLREHPEVALVILDVMLPGMSGYDVLAHLQRNSNHPPVIVVSALAEFSSEAQALSAGAVAYIRKGELSPHEIVEKAREFVDQSKAQLPKKEYA